MHTDPVLSAAIVVGVVFIQAASGTAWWAWARKGSVSWAELIGMGLALGTFASMLSSMLLAGTALDRLGWALPAILTGLTLLVPRARHALRDSNPTLAPTQVVAIALGIVAGVPLLIANWARVPLGGAAPTSFTDLYFFEAISRGLAQFGPSQSILMTGGSLRYHWFTYAWAGELAQTASTGPFVTITRVLPVVTLIGVSLVAAAWAGRLSRIRWVPSLAVLLIIAGGYSGALYGAVLNFDSPSQSMTTLWLLALAVAFLAVTDGRTGASGLIALAALAAACTGGKISHAAVGAGGIALVTVVALIARASWWRRSLLAATVALCAMAVTYWWVLAGVAIDRNLTEQIAVKASTWQGLDPLVGRGGVILGTSALMLAIAARAAGVGWLLARHRSRMKPDVLFVSGALVVGFGAMLLLREGVNELWFVLAASALASVVSADGVGSALRSLTRRPRPLVRPMLWSVAVALPASVAALVLSRTWTENGAVLNWLAPVTAWLLVAVGALLVALRRRPQGRVLVPAVAIAIAALTLTSIGTRPSALWTSSRPITTERGEIEPQGGLPGEAAAPTVPGGSVDWSDQVQAANWLAASTAANDVVATSDPLSALIPALAGKRMYIAGNIYQVGLGQADELDDVRKRSDISTSLVHGLDAAALADLCANDVDYLWIEGGTPEELGLPVASVNGSVTILSLPPERCAE